MGIHYRSSEATARALADELDDAFLVRADLSLPEDVDALVAELKQVAGRVDVLVNNAGYNINAPMLSMKLDDYDAVSGVPRGTSSHRFTTRAPAGGTGTDVTATCRTPPVVHMATPAVTFAATATS